MTSIRNVLVVGATGKQGSALVHALLRPAETAEAPTSSFHVFALTRNTASEAARALIGAEQSVADRITLTEGNLDDPDSIRKVFRDVSTQGKISGVFTVLAYPGLGKNADKEEKQGRTMAEISLEFDVELYVYSTGIQVRETGDGMLDPSHRAKLRVEHYCRELGNKGLKWVILRPGFFMENFEGFLGTVTTTLFSECLPKDTTIPIIASADIGNVAAGVFRVIGSPVLPFEVVLGFDNIMSQNHARYIHKTLSVTSGAVTMSEIKADYTRATNRTMPSAPAAIIKALARINAGAGNILKESLLSHEQRIRGKYPAFEEEPAFLEAVFLAGLTEATGTTEKTYHPDGKSTVYPLASPSTPSGPYFMDTSSGRLHQAFRLYDDFAGAFSQSLLQRPDGRFETLSAQVPASGSLTVGVPSRLYSRRSRDKPLAGVRIGVKDIFALAGVKQSNGNRAWYHLYPPATQTGTAIQRLIDAGAVIVGLQKASQFANGEVATADWVDYHAPFNPRGDGYQDASSSSSGAGASIASYEWLDLAIGSDTGGSIRGPATVQGLFGNRPTHGLVSLDHLMPLSKRLDTVGFLARDPNIWDAANAALYGDNYTSFKTNPSYPKAVYLLAFSGKNSTRASMQRKFVADLAGFLGATVQAIDLEERWKATAPGNTSTQTLSQLLNTTYAALTTKEQTKLVRDPFYKDYAAAHGGRRPFVDPVPLARWAWGDSQPESVLADAAHNKTLFMEWFNNEGFSFIGRNTYLNPPLPPFGYSASKISVFSEAPDSVFPIGQVPTFSPITGHDEFLPVVVNVVVAKGCDGLLPRLAGDLIAAGILQAPKVGAGLTGGEILLRRDLR
ncbi:hypothetical protein O9K51_00042 [Purpureocillium lavendulum]|uniref:Amidase domain-containing protein n=1 Tax=Purpureocillium lavendulum TaxID=1247861 RepID=A0AB34G204_9HYPO|nr:hypothetical protein O9K51_00042 [Purpureocillium lavendulum]